MDRAYSTIVVLVLIKASLIDMVRLVTECLKTCSGYSKVEFCMEGVGWQLVSDINNRV